MNLLLKRAITLLELLIAITLVSIIAIGFYSIHLFSHFQVLSSDRRAQVQNEASYILEHMSKNIARAIGNEVVYGANTIIDTNDPTGEGETTRIKVYIDGNNDGIRQEPVNNPYGNQDYWIAYRYFNNIHQVQFCSRCKNKQCGRNQCATGWEPVSLKMDAVSGLRVTKPGGDILNASYIEVTVTTCFDPDGQPYACGTPENPQIDMTTQINLPNVSIR